MVGMAGFESFGAEKQGIDIKILSNLLILQAQQLQRDIPTLKAGRQVALALRAMGLLPTRYLHAVFTCRAIVRPALQNKKRIFNLLFHAHAVALLEVARHRHHRGDESRH